MLEQINTGFIEFYRFSIYLALYFKNLLVTIKYNAGTDQRNFLSILHFYDSKGNLGTITKTGTNDWLREVFEKVECSSDVFTFILPWTLEELGIKDAIRFQPEIPKGKLNVLPCLVDKDYKEYLYVSFEISKSKFHSYLSSNNKITGNFSFTAYNTCGKIDYCNTAINQSGAVFYQKYMPDLLYFIEKYRRSTNESQGLDLSLSRPISFRPREYKAIFIPRFVLQSFIGNNSFQLRSRFLRAGLEIGEIENSLAEFISITIINNSHKTVTPKDFLVWVPDVKLDDKYFTDEMKQKLEIKNETKSKKEISNAISCNIDSTVKSLHMEMDAKEMDNFDAFNTSSINFLTVATVFSLIKKC